MIFLKFSLAYFIVRIQYLIHSTYKIRINQLFVLSVRFPVNRQLLVELKVIYRFSTVWMLAPLTPTSFKGQLYVYTVDSLATSLSHVYIFFFTNSHAWVFN